MSRVIIACTADEASAVWEAVSPEVAATLVFVGTGLEVAETYAADVESALATIRAPKGKAS